MNSLKEKIIAIAEEITASSGYFLIDVVLRGTERDKVIEIFVDAEKNVTANDCGKISSKMIQVIEEREIINSAYRLDVSSPGIDRPLKFLKQFPKHINRKFEITYMLGDEKKKIIGTLKEVSENRLTFSSNVVLDINFNDIIQAKVLVSFS